MKKHKKKCPSYSYKIHHSLFGVPVLNSQTGFNLHQWFFEVKELVFFFSFLEKLFDNMPPIGVFWVMRRWSRWRGRLVTSSMMRPGKWKKRCKQTSIWRIFQKYKKPIYCHWKIKLIIQYLLEYRLLGLEWTGSPYTAGMPHSLDDDILCAVSTDISGGGMGFILPLSENLKIKIKIKLV